MELVYFVVREKDVVTISRLLLAILTYYVHRTTHISCIAQFWDGHIKKKKTMHSPSTMRRQTDISVVYVNVFHYKLFRIHPHTVARWTYVHVHHHVPCALWALGNFILFLHRLNASVSQCKHFTRLYKL